MILTSACLCIGWNTSGRRLSVKEVFSLNYPNKTFFFLPWFSALKKLNRSPDLPQLLHQTCWDFYISWSCYCLFLAPPPCPFVSVSLFFSPIVSVSLRFCNFSPFCLFLSIFVSLSFSFCFCQFLSILFLSVSVYSVCLYSFLYASIHFCQFLSTFVYSVFFFQFLSASVHFCPLISVYVSFCLFMFVSVLFFWYLVSARVERLCVFCFKF